MGRVLGQGGWASVACAVPLWLASAAPAQPWPESSAAPARPWHAEDDGFYPLRTRYGWLPPTQRLSDLPNLDDPSRRAVAPISQRLASHDPLALAMQPPPPLVPDPSAQGAMGSASTVHSAAPALAPSPMSGPTLGSPRVVSYDDPPPEQYYTQQNKAMDSMPPPKPDDKKSDAKKDDKPAATTSDTLEAFDGGCCHSWILEADLIGLRRHRTDQVPILAESGGTWVVLSGQDLKWDYELGARARLSYSWGCDRALEFTYLGLPEWSTSKVLAGDLMLHGPGFDLSVNPGIFAVEGHSFLHSAEASVRTGITDCWSWSAGFRYLRFEDQLTVSELNAPFINALRIDTQNDLYGAVIGTDFRLLDCGKVGLEGRVKFGMYGNVALQHVQSSFLGPPVSGKDHRFATTGEFELMLTYRLTDCIQIRAGYQVLGIGGLALAPDQIRSSDISTGQAHVDFNSLFLDGAYVGVRFVW